VYNYGYRSLSKSNRNCSIEREKSKLSVVFDCFLLKRIAVVLFGFTPLYHQLAQAKKKGDTPTEMHAAKVLKRGEFGAKYDASIKLNC
jgi:hypothetical protein